MTAISPAIRLRELINRQDKVLTVMHPPCPSLAKVMELAGVEAGFIGTSVVVGFYTGLADVGVASLNECITVAGLIARAVNFPIILDGDTGHGGIMAVRRMVRDCIAAGISGVRIDDQSMERKRGTGSGGIVVEDLDIVLARYRAAVDMRDELDPNFVVMAQCYAGEADNATFDDAMQRLKAYKEVGGVDWVQFTAPRSVEDIRQARRVVDGPFSVMQGHMPSYLTDKELLELGINVAWAVVPVRQVLNVSLYDFIKDYMERGVQATQDFRERYADHPATGSATADGIYGENVDKFRELEAKYFSADSPG